MYKMNGMKKIISIVIIAAAFGCNQPKTETTEKKMEAMEPAKDSAVKSNLASLNFASKNDLSCGMPISAGLSDTTTYKGKLYGFCSAECKEDFLKDPEAHLAAK
jgi:YHS domain-containing protein